MSGTPSDWISFWLFEGCSFTSIVGRHTSTTGTTRSLPNINLIAGTTYYVVISTWPAPQSTPYTLDVTEVVPAVPNCDASLTTTINVPIAGDISWTAATGSPAITSYELTVGTSSGASDVLTTTDVGNVLTYNLGTLTYSTTYFVNLVPKNGIGSATGCTEQTFDTVATPPSNDDCSNASPYTNDFTMFAEGACTGTPNMLDLSSATDDIGSDNPSCDTFGNFGVWYTWTATSLALTFTTGTGAPGIAIYEAGSCGSLVGISCLNNVSGSLEGLTIGNNYIIHIWDDTAGNSVDFCLEEFTPPPPPANDDCSGAIPLTPGNAFASNPIDGSVTSATSGADPVAGCGSDGPGTWYSVVVPADGIITIETGPDAATGNTGFDSLIEAFSGTCGALTSIECDDDDAVANLFSILELTGLTPASTIYIRVWESGGNEDEPFSISAYNASLSIEDNKIDGFSIYPNPVNDILRFNALDAIESVSIYNLLGQEVLRTQPNVSNTEVDMTSLPSGIYVVKVKVGEQFGSYKIIKE